MSESIVAIIVTYNPQIDKLKSLLSCLASQVQHVVVCDNGMCLESLKAFNSLSVDFYTILDMKGNVGIAAAQNAGISAAKGLNATYVVLFDQDSEPALDMVARLVDVASSKFERGIRVGGVGPRYFDSRQNNPPPFIRIRGFRVERQRCTENDTAVEVDYLIASGCLIPIRTLDAVGGMREDLFIDYVDIEWGLRAKMLGFQSFGACRAAMKHDLGDYPLVFLGKKIPLHSPLRHYYHFRNAVSLYRDGRFSMNWKIADGWRLLLKYCFYTLFARPRLSHCKMMSLGILHGLGGKMGKFQSS